MEEVEREREREKKEGCDDRWYSITVSQFMPVSFLWSMFDTR